MTLKKTSIVTFANQKGGVGKTTCTVNIASAYAKMEKKILIVDADPQANTTSHLGVLEKAHEEKKYLYDAIESESEKLLKFVLPTKFKNIDILASDSRLRNINKKFKGEMNQFQVLHPFLKSKEVEKYDYVFIDTHPSFDVLPQSALTISDYYVIPLFPEGHSLQGLGDQISYANSVIKYQNPMLTFLGCIISMFDNKNATHKKVEKQFRDLAKDGGFKIFSNKIPSSKLISSAALAEIPIHFFRPGSQIAHAFTILAGEIAPELKGKRKGRRQSLPDPAIIHAAIASDNAFEEEGVIY
jgi:chromosome partitioning protein